MFGCQILIFQLETGNAVFFPPDVTSPSTMLPPPPPWIWPLWTPASSCPSLPKIWSGGSRQRSGGRCQIWSGGGRRLSSRSPPARLHCLLCQRWGRREGRASDGEEEEAAPTMTEKRRQQPNPRRKSYLVVAARSRQRLVASGRRRSHREISGNGW